MTDGHSGFGRSGFGRSGFGVSDVRGSTPNVRKWTFGVFGRSGFGRSGLDPERPN